jgi:ATP-binding cassette subfamily C protein CydC
MKNLVVSRRLLRQLRRLTGWMAMAILLGLLSILSGLGLVILSAYLIAKAALHPPFHLLFYAIIGVQLLGIIRGILRYIERIISHETTFRLLTHLRVWFYRAFEPIVPARIMAVTRGTSTDFTSGDLLSRIVADIDTLQEFYIRVIAPPVIAVLLGILMLFALGAYNVLLAYTLLVFFVLAGIGVPCQTYLLSRKLGRRIIAVRAALHMSMVDSIQGVADLLAYNQDEAQAQNIRTLNGQLVRLQASMAQIEGLREALGILLVDGCGWIMLIIAIPLVRSGRLSGVFLAVLVLAVIGSFEAITPLASAAQHLGGSLQAGQRLFEVIDTPPTIREPAQPAPLPGRYDLEIQHLSFRYSNNEPDVLKDVSFTVPQGRCVAIVGASGAGKSTIANLLARLWDYERGSIQLGGHELADYAQQDIHRLIGVVEQHTHLFNATVRENLLIARPEASQKEIQEAAKQACIHSVIEALPQGYETLIGEQGHKLSGGERQRLALARAMLKNAPILIFDEATANLDTLTEHEVLRAIHRQIQGRTTLIITHRLVGLENVDEILVMQAGTIKERGTQYELLQAEGLYWKLWQIQNQAIAAQ